MWGTKEIFPPKHQIKLLTRILSVLPCILSTSYYFSFTPSHISFASSTPFSETSSNSFCHLFSFFCLHLFFIQLRLPLPFHFSVSAPAPAIFNLFGFTIPNLCVRAREVIAFYPPCGAPSLLKYPRFPRLGSLHHWSKWRKMQYMVGERRGERRKRGK